MSVAAVSQQVFVLFILIVVGMLARRIKVLTEEGIQSISAFLVNFCMPLLAITSMQRSFTPDIMSEIIQIFLIALAVHFASFLLGFLFVRKMDKPKAAVFHYALIFSNSGYIGIPVIQAALGQEATIYAVAYMMASTVAMWTVGIFVFTGKEGIRLKNIASNPGVIGMVIGLALFLLQWKIPAVPLGAMNMIADVTPTISMILVGANLPSISLGDLRDGSVYVQSILRLGVLPVALFLVLRLLGIEGNVMISTVLLTGMPVAAVTSVFATQYHADAEYASKLIFLTTLLSIPAVPLLAMLF